VHYGIDSIMTRGSAVLMGLRQKGAKKGHSMYLSFHTPRKGRGVFRVNVIPVHEKGQRDLASGGKKGHHKFQPHKSTYVVVRGRPSWDFKPPEPK